MERKSAYGTLRRVRLVTLEQVSTAGEGPRLRTEAGAGAFARELIGHKDREHFVVMHLDGQHVVRSAEIVSVGTLSSSLVHPREVFKGAFLSNAAAILCAHNHPSGRLDGSQEDRKLCERLREAGELLGVPLLDFLIVSSTSHWAARGDWF